MDTLSLLSKMFEAHQIINNKENMIMENEEEMEDIAEHEMVK